MDIVFVQGLKVDTVIGIYDQVSSYQLKNITINSPVTF